MRAEASIMKETSDVVLLLAGVAAISSETPIPNINDTTMDKISERLTFALDGASLPARALLVNLSARLRKFHSRPRALSFAAGACRFEATRRAKKQTTVRKMTKRAARFTLADISRATRAAKEQGAAAVDILPDGTIRIRIGRHACSARPSPRPKNRHSRLQAVDERDMPKPPFPSFTATGPGTAKASITSS